MYRPGVIIRYRLVGKVCYRIANQTIYDMQSKLIANLLPRVVEATIGKYLQGLQGTYTEPMKITEQKQEISDFVKSHSEKPNENFGIEVTALQITVLEPDEESQAILNQLL